jgi:hypothetical protein
MIRQWKTIFVLVFLFSCGDKNNKSDYYPIPYVPVNFQINMDLPAYSDLINVGSYLYMPFEGYKGVIIYHSITGDYIALERACTFNPLEACSYVSVDNSGLVLRCGQYEGKDWLPCCNSKFTMEGIVLEGPAVYPLQRYRVQKMGNTLYISN